MRHTTAERVRDLYDQGLEGCANRDSVQVSRAVLALIALLDFDEATTVSDGFHRLYDYCLDNAVKQQFDRVAWVLGGLREAWDDAARTADAIAS
jgi:flagellin-specific chaperone FliS